MRLNEFQHGARSRRDCSRRALLPMAEKDLMLSCHITLYPPPTISVAPSTASLQAGQTQQFTATTTNSFYSGATWSITPAGVGTISANGLCTAPTPIPANQTVTVTGTRNWTDSTPEQVIHEKTQRNSYDQAPLVQSCGKARLLARPTNDCPLAKVCCQ